MTTILGEYIEIESLENNIDSKCMCTGKHVPDPHALYAIDVPGGSVLLCPTSAANLFDLLKKYEEVGGTPLGSVTKHYGKYIRDLAKTIYQK